MAAAAHIILITIDERFVPDVAEERLAAIARHVLEVERVGDCELGVVITDDETTRRLNREYAGDDHSTDVLSFSLREGEEFSSPDAVDCLGEVIISYTTAARQAKEAGRSVDDETAHLLVHGILHLLGYDHAEPEEEREMRARESALIGGRSGHMGL